MIKKTAQFDHILLFVVVALMGVGLVMVYSASSITSLAQMSDSLYYFKRQLLWVIVGLGAMLLTSGIPYNKLEKIAVPLLGIAIVLLIIVISSVIISPLNLDLNCLLINFFDILAGSPLVNLLIFI